MSNLQSLKKQPFHLHQLKYKLYNFNRLYSDLLMTNWSLLESIVDVNVTCDFFILQSFHFLICTFVCIILLTDNLLIGSPKTYVERIVINTIILNYLTDLTLNFIIRFMKVLEFN